MLISYQVNIPKLNYFRLKVKDKLPTQENGTDRGIDKQTDREMKGWRNEQTETECKICVNLCNYG